MIDREDTRLAAPFAKRVDDERFLAELNVALHELEGRCRGDEDERFATLHVTGAPRSGTTLLTQLVAARLDVAPISNLAAAFWEAPCVGLRLARKLLPRELPRTFDSTYGRTGGLEQPHEFGYFWSQQLGYREMASPTDEERAAVDWDAVRGTLIAMTHAAERPLVFKSFMFAFHAVAARAALPSARFLLVKRDPVDNALSILTMRRRYSGDESYWTSTKPATWAERAPLTPHEQVVAQVLDLEAEYEALLAQAGGSLVLRYEDVCAAPEDALDAIAALMDLGDGPPARVGAPIEPIAVRAGAESEDRRLIEAALARLG